MRVGSPSFLLSLVLLGKPRWGYPQEGLWQERGKEHLGTRLGNVFSRKTATQSLPGFDELGVHKVDLGGGFELL